MGSAKRSAGGTDSTKSNGSRIKNSISHKDKKPTEGRLPTAIRIVELALEQSDKSDNNDGNEEIEIEAKVKMRVQIPAQDQHLPHRIETMVEEAGQELKRAFYQKI